MAKPKGHTNGGGVSGHRSKKMGRLGDPLKWRRPGTKRKKKGRHRFW